MFSISSTNPNKLIVPDNIDYLLDQKLIPAPTPPSRHTPKFCIEDVPGILVRDEGPELYDEVQAAIDCAYEMTDYGVSVLPSAVVAHRGLTYVVTLLVKGRSLEDMVKENADERVMALADDFMGRGIRYVHMSAKQNKPIANDVTSINQTMYGTTMYDFTPRLRLVDLPWTSSNSELDYTTSIEYGVKNVLEIEREAGVRLDRTRTALDAALAEWPPIVSAERIQPMQHSLRTDEPYEVER